MEQHDIVPEAEPQGDAVGWQDTPPPLTSRNRGNNKIISEVWIRMKNRHGNIAFLAIRDLLCRKLPRQVTLDTINLAAESLYLLLLARNMLVPPRWFTSPEGKEESCPTQQEITRYLKARREEKKNARRMSKPMVIKIPGAAEPSVSAECDIPTLGGAHDLARYRKHFANKPKPTAQEEADWVAENILFASIPVEDAPSLSAYRMYLWCRSDAENYERFLKQHATMRKMVETPPSKSDAAPDDGALLDSFFAGLRQFSAPGPTRPGA